MKAFQAPPVAESPFILNAWQAIAFSSEVGDQPLPRRIADVPVVLYRTPAGLPVALHDRCPHRFVPLSTGKRVGDEIECGYHGLRFSPDGNCTLVPGQTVVPAQCRVRSFPLQERYGLVWIWVGNPELAEASLLPALDWLEDPEWSTVSGYLYFDCNHHLLTDNLLDLTHETYVHHSSIGNDAEESIAHFEPMVSREGATVRVERQMPDIAPPPFFTPYVKNVSKVDRRQTAFFTPPGTNLTESVLSLAETSEAIVMTRTLHLLAPETDRSTHYFWSLSIHADLKDAVPAADLERAVPAIFGQDRRILALQQLALDELRPPAAPGVALRVDDGPLRARRLYRSVLRKEQEAVEEPTL